MHKYNLKKNNMLTESKFRKGAKSLRKYTFIN